MCGLAGVIDPGGRVPKNTAEKMIASIRYRGVDEQGTASVGPCQLGHARLAVVDPENGGQPMYNADKSVTVVFNGEIYNFIELRNQLKTKGYQFKSRCDTEVLVHLWVEYGVSMLDMLVGMFVFCLWDDKAGKGILARDRQGIKPCYWSESNGSLYFASEIKALAAGLPTELVVDDASLGLMHAFNYCPPPRTCFRDVEHLMPGSYIAFDRFGNYNTKTYWRWPLFDKKHRFDEQEFDDLLNHSIELQLRFDVGGCVFLSGGVDSSILIAKLAEFGALDRLHVYGLACELPEYSEIDLSRKVASQFGVELTPVQYGPDVIPNSLPDCIWHADQPHGDFSFVLIRELCKRAHQDGLIVAFNGDGPDEALSGFGHNEAFLANQVRTNFPLQRYFDEIAYLPRGISETLFSDGFRAHQDDPVDHFEKMLEPYRDLEPIEQIIGYETGFLMPGNNLIKGDRMGAGLSIEGRSPFLDHRISEYFAGLLVPEKFSGGYGKFCLKKYGLRFFDEHHMFRKKSMPTLPIGEWIKGPLQCWALQTLKSLPRSRYNIEAAVRLFEDHCAGRANNTRVLRTLFAASIWLSSVEA